MPDRIGPTEQCRCPLIVSPGNLEVGEHLGQRPETVHVAEITPDLHAFSSEPFRLVKLPVPEHCRRQEVEDVSAQPDFPKLLTQRKGALPCRNGRGNVTAEPLCECKHVHRVQFLKRQAHHPGEIREFRCACDCLVPTTLYPEGRGQSQLCPGDDVRRAD